MEEIHTTGLACPSCKEPVAMIVNILKNMLVLQCQACGKRWFAAPRSSPPNGKESETVD